MKKRVSIVGGRGYAGAQFLDLLAGHPELELGLAVSSTREGLPIHSVAERWAGRPDTFRRLEPGETGEVEAEVWILALPNGASRPWVQALEHSHPEAVVLDLGADYRFDVEWVYGLPELRREQVRVARRIANPGCYATGAQLALAPVVTGLVTSPLVFGISGHSGAGRTPSPRNDPERLMGNVIPYALSGHLHEREVSHHLGTSVRFTPHVAEFFRGISLTVAVELAEPTDPDRLLRDFASFYEGETLVEVIPTPPEVREVREKPLTRIGGFTVDAREPTRAVWVVALDNLMKGAASQAMQNVNLALGLNERLGVMP